MAADVLTQSEFAEKCGVSIRQFRRWRAAGKIPIPDALLPGVPRWSRKVVDRVLAGQSARGFARNHAPKSDRRRSPNPVIANDLQERA